ncbi:glycerol-3-phosphate dehydrogenase [Vannielia sp. SX4]|uniref:glycerol-3-phosphate dehydrogenase n=1 Tax=Vannielia sp. SX4 TaxID=3463852 RepID=UPI004058F3DB
MSEGAPAEPVDLFVIGGGINGCGIARDAAGRGLSVSLAEMGDLAQATSSSSTKLFHGGLRYLEFFEFRLVREALKEREVLLRNMPHISWPMRFVLPYHRDMRFEKATPTSKLLSIFMPWMRGRRPAWLIRFGLFLYDHLGGRKILPGTQTLTLKGREEGKVLQERFEHAYEYSDCWVDDARLVVLNARDAEARGARVMTRTKVLSAGVENGLWQVETQNTETGETTRHSARMLINAGGPWVGEIIRGTIRSNSSEGVRLVRGSHIVTPRLTKYEDKAYFFQGEDGRIIFSIPYERDFTLIGTTEEAHESPDVKPECTPEERDYLIDFANRYLREPINADNVVWTYSGVRPLYDDGASSATAATRDYTLKVDTSAGAPVLNIFGGKITTYRRLAEAALEKIAPHFQGLGRKWTENAPLPGGDFAHDGVTELRDGLVADFPFLTQDHALRLVRAYGTEARGILGEAKALSDLGRPFGYTLWQAEVDWLMAHEYARSAADVLWRRSKLGLHLNEDEVQALDSYMKHHRRDASPAAAE